MKKHLPISLFVSFSLALILCTSHAEGQLIKDKPTLSNMQMILAKQKKLAIGRQAQLFGLFNRPLTTDEKQAMEYLYAYMPLSDLADYDGSFFLKAVKVALKARSQMPWGKMIPEDIFLHFVLPLRINNENLDTFRIAIFDELKQRVKGMSMHDAALEVNHWCHEKVTYRGSDDRTSAPLATVKTSFGRCGEESTFTVSALRTVGIPARQVYTPRWAHTDDNHAWVEAWVDGKWYFMGACEPEPELNMGWFAEPSRRAMLIHTRAYGWYNGNEKVIDSQERFSELNLISNYAESKIINVKVTDKSGNPVKDASVEYQLYNYSEFYPIAKGMTNAKGLSSICSGLGDLLIWASKDGIFDYRKVTVETSDTVVLQLGREHPGFEIFDLSPPVEKTPLPSKVTEIQQKYNSLKLRTEDSIRSSYMSSFKDSAWAAGFAFKLGLNPAKVTKLVTASYGNWQEITSFLQNTETSKRTWAVWLLESISEKDLRDTREAILRDHLDHAFVYNNKLSESDRKFFAQNILSGRIANEMMLPWRAFLQKKFTADFAGKAQKDISVITAWIKGNIRIDETANLHSRAPLSPRGVYELRVSDKRSRDIFFVALCRSMGIPARINSYTNIPQYWKVDTWNNISFEPVKENITQKGIIHFTNATNGFQPKYAINFTIARFRDGLYRTVDYDYGLPVDNFLDSLYIEAGEYYLVTGNRLSDGSVLASISYFKVQPGQLTDIKVAVRETSEKVKPLGTLSLDDYSLMKIDSKLDVPLSSLAGNKGLMLVWIQPDKEPSKHVLADIPAVKNILEKWGGGISFIVPEAEADASFNPGDYKGLPDQSIFTMEKNNLLFEKVEKFAGHSLKSNLPIVVILDAKGSLLYLSEGYKIGIGEHLAKEINKMK